jgi:radical SAM protein with 4Fe4S-binding SPASM domain
MTHVIFLKNDFKGAMGLPGLEFTTRIGCRVACDYCPQALFTRAYQQNLKSPEDKILSVENLKKILAKLPSQLVIVFAGYSEPWLNPHATELLATASRRGHPLEVFTTLEGMPIQEVETIASLSYDRFSIHLPSNDNRMQIVVTSEYLAKLSALALGIPNLRLVYYGERPHEKIPTQWKKRAFRDPLHDRAGNLSIHSPITRRQRLVGEICCSSMPVRHMVLPNGDVSLCCMDWSVRHRLGNLLEQSYEEIISSAEMHKIRNGWKDEQKDILCRHCPRGFHKNVDWRAKLWNDKIPKLKQQVSW